jgi:hypothetical protein
MKRFLLTMIAADALIILSLTSCNKEVPLPIHTTPFTEPISINNLVAGRWIKNDRGIYVCIIKGVLSNVNTRNRSVNIYLIANGKETQINRPISFMKGKLWAGNANIDIELNFLPENRIFPFSYLVIKVVII